LPSWKRAIVLHRDGNLNAMDEPASMEQMYANSLNLFLLCLEEVLSWEAIVFTIPAQAGQQPHATGSKHGSARSSGILTFVDCTPGAISISSYWNVMDVLCCNTQGTLNSASRQCWRNGM